MLYRYPQVAFPYEQLVTENRARSFEENEFELMDTGVFDDSAYFDLFVEVAKADPETLYLRIEAINRATQSAPLHLLPLVTFRNTWSWGMTDKPELHALDHQTIEARHPVLGCYYWTAEEPQRLLFTENESNTQRLFGDGSLPQGRKDAFNRYLVEGDREAVHAESKGTRAAAHYHHEVPPGGAVRFHLRLGKEPPGKAPFSDTSILTKRREEADRFYGVVQEGISDEDDRLVQRMAFAGLVWSKQLYYYDVERWLEGDPGQPPPPKQRWRGRNSECTHLCNFEVISMPDKWEYPWYASWDLAFHCLPFALIDPEFAKQQLLLLTREWYMHPNGRMPAYEWNFSDVNPPVHAWAAWRVFQIDRKQRGDAGDIAFLERVFHKLMLNFTWWVNRKDADQRSLFQGGFLGLDNIGVFDRNAPLPTGGHLEQADGTSWMAMYSLNLMRIAMELALHNSAYEEIATKFFDHFLQIAQAMASFCNSGFGLWDEEDEFYYDTIHLPSGHHQRMKLRSMVGLIPLFAVETLEPETLERLPAFKRRLQWTMENRPDLKALVSHWEVEGLGHRRLLSLLRGHRMKRLLFRMLAQLPHEKNFNQILLRDDQAQMPNLGPFFRDFSA